MKEIQLNKFPAEVPVISRADMVQIISQIASNIQETNEQKGGEYSGAENALYNFERQGNEKGLLPEQVLAIFLDKHLSSINSYIKRLSKVVVDDRLVSPLPVTSEPVESRIQDAILYLCLFMGQVHRRKLQQAYLPPEVEVTAKVGSGVVMNDVATPTNLLTRKWITDNKTPAKLRPSPQSLFDADQYAEPQQKNDHESIRFGTLIKVVQYEKGNDLQPITNHISEPMIVLDRRAIDRKTGKYILTAVTRGGHVHTCDTSGVTVLYLNEGPEVITPPLVIGQPLVGKYSVTVKGIICHELMEEPLLQVTAAKDIPTEFFEVISFTPVRSTDDFVNFNIRLSEYPMLVKAVS